MSSTQKSEKIKKKVPLSAIIFSVAFPLIIGKCLIVYFGANYSESPGQGYGYGLFAAISFTVGMAIRFVWKYHDYSD